ncbi:MAG: copper-translocating P-type ATPase [Candidatus Zixiibacteriota bacterium]|nr:MAG: copper-translocating P-type ATPase [candidate division Zixibacteria bacterium]
MASVSQLDLKIDGMHCAGCVSSIEKAVAAMDGVKDCRVNLALSSAQVAFDPGRAAETDIISGIERLGYRAAVGPSDVLTSNVRELSVSRRNFLSALFITLPLMVIAMAPVWAGGSLFSDSVDAFAQAVIAATVLFYAGRSILADAFRQTRQFRANMNSLIALGTLTAFGWSLYVLIRLVYGGPAESLYFDSAAMIVTLILLGRYLEARARGRAGRAVKALMDLKPSKAMAVINGVELEVDVAAIRPGMRIVVRPGERVAADGDIVESRPVIDESMLTGESLPVDKEVGDRVIGGSLNGNVSFTMKVTASGEQSFLASVIRLVSEAQSRKAPVQRLADRVASVFVPAVMAVAALTFAAWYLFAPDSPMLVRSVIAVLIIACPCALGLATPTAVLVGTGRAARGGIIVRGGDVLERLSRINTVIFDKTGTLTHGQLEVVHVQTFDAVTERNFLKLIGSAEMKSEHPVARAIVAHMKWQQIPPAAVKDVEAFPGFGLSAECDGRQVIIGNRKMMSDRRIALGAADEPAEKEMEKGRTVVLGAVDGRVVGLIALADRVRDEAQDVIGQLKGQRRRVIMLSGDTFKTARGVAHSLGINDFQAGVRPEQKKTVVESLHLALSNVAMVGDGINDAPALAAADVGVAIGSGTDVAIESAGVILVRPELTGVLDMFDIAARTMKIIRQNLFWAFAYNVLAIPIAAGLFYPAFGWTLSPMIAAAAMAFSSVFVVSNSLRLGRTPLDGRAQHSFN